MTEMFEMPSTSFWIGEVRREGAISMDCRLAPRIKREEVG